MLLELRFWPLDGAALLFNSGLVSTKFLTFEFLLHYSTIQSLVWEMGHRIPVGFPFDGSQFHYSSCDWDMTGTKWEWAKQELQYVNNRSVFIYGLNMQF